jgi:hypothetical protein
MRTEPRFALAASTLLRCGVAAPFWRTVDAQGWASPSLQGRTRGVSDRAARQRRLHAAASNTDQTKEPIR